SGAAAINRDDDARTRPLPDSTPARGAASDEVRPLLDRLDRDRDTAIVGEPASAPPAHRAPRYFISRRAAEQRPARADGAPRLVGPLVVALVVVASAGAAV